MKSTLSKPSSLNKKVDKFSAENIAKVISSDKFKTALYDEIMGSDSSSENQKISYINDFFN